MHLYHLFYLPKHFSNSLVEIDLGSARKVANLLPARFEAIQALRSSLRYVTLGATYQPVYYGIEKFMTRSA